MKNLIGRIAHKLFSRKTLSYFLIAATFFNSFAPTLIALTPHVIASEPTNTNLSYSASKKSFELAVSPTSEAVEYSLYTKTSTKIDAAYGSGEPNDGMYVASIFAGTQSGSDIVSENVERGILKTKLGSVSLVKYFIMDGVNLRNVLDTSTDSMDLTESESNWLGNPLTFGDLTTGVTYHAPFNQDLSVQFTSLPSNNNTLTFNKVTLTREQMQASGALSSEAYEITSNMADGTFTYDLTLPNPTRKTDVSVQYSEDGVSFDTSTNVTSESSKVSIKNLNHFTIFVVAYDALPSTSNTNYPSLGFQATQTSEFGDYIHLGSESRLLSSVTVTMSDWAKYSDYSSDLRYMGNSASWTHPITINIYTAELNPDGTPKTKLGSVTQNISIPWRPESSAECGTAWKSIDGHCYNGLAFNAVIDMSSLNLVLPDDIIVAVAYNTNTWGYAPIGQHGPYESLNVAVPENQNVSVGTDDSVSEVFWNTVTRSNYTDGGASGYGVFRKDTNWSPNGTVAFKIETIDTTPTCNGSSSFDNFNLGSVNGQDGWKATGNFDQAVVKNNYGFASFGCKSLRISDAITSGSFGDQIFAAPLPNGSGETSASLGSFTVGTRQNHFEAQFDLASVMTAQQNGMHVSISPDRGDGSRMSYLRLEDNASGIDAYFDDVQVTTNPAHFVETKIASALSRTTPHTIKFVMDFVEGPSNDVVEIWIDEVKVHTGTSWENYYRYDSEASAEQSPRIVKTLLFRESGNSNLVNSGKGFLIDNVSLSSALIVADTTAPTTPTNGSPNNSFIATNNFDFNWDDSSDESPVHYIFHSSLNGAAVNGILTTGLWTSGNLNTSMIHSSGAPNGKWYWQVKAIDSEGNESGWSPIWNVTIDTVAPSTPTLTWPIDGVHTSDNTPLMQWDDSSDLLGVAGYLYRVYYHCSNPSLFSTCTNVYPSSLGLWLTASQYQAGTTSDGTYYWQVRAQDNAGNQSDWTDAEKVTIDTAAPDVDITTPASNIVKGIVEIRGAVTDENPHHYYLVVQNSSDVIVAGPGTVNDSTSFTNKLLMSWNTSLFPDGNYKIRLEARDAANNKDSGSIFIKTVTVDNSGPSIPTTPMPSNNGYVNLHDFTFAWGNSSDVSMPITYEWEASYGTSENGDGSFTNRIAYHSLSSANVYSPGTPDNTYYWHVRAIDSLGNASTWSDTWKVTVDTVKPESSITLPVNSGTGSSIITNEWNGSIAGTSSDANSGVSRVDLSIMRESNGEYWNGTEWVSGTESSTRVTANGQNSWTYELSDPSQDSYTITSHAVDFAGNIESSYSLTVVLDKTIPEVAISLDPSTPDASNGWYRTQPEITLSATDTNIDKIEYQWGSDSGAWIFYSGPFKPAIEGGHILYYRAHDKAGNYSTTGIKNIKWDKTELVDGPLNMNVSPNPTSGSTSLVKWEAASDNIGIDRYEIIWKLGDVVHISSVGSDVRSFEIDHLTEGNWKVTVRASDYSGNSKEATVDLRVDRTAPSAPTLVLSSTSQGTANLTWNSVDGASSYIIWYGTTSGIYLYGANVGNVTSYSVKGLGSGNYYFIVRANDAAGNGSVNSNEVSTGTIIGAPGVQPGTAPAGFVEEPSVLGEQTKAPEQSSSLESVSNVLGTTSLGQLKNLISRWWFWVIVLIFVYIVFRFFSPKKRS